MFKKCLFIFITVYLFFLCCYAGSNDNLNQKYLHKPTGEYGVAFKDFHWINNNICPDPMFNGKNKNDEDRPRIGKAVDRTRLGPLVGSPMGICTTLHADKPGYGPQLGVYRREFR